MRRNPLASTNPKPNTSNQLLTSRDSELLRTPERVWVHKLCHHHVGPRPQLFKGLARRLDSSIGWHAACYVTGGVRRTDCPSARADNPSRRTLCGVLARAYLFV